MQKICILSFWILTIFVQHRLTAQTTDFIYLGQKVIYKVDSTVYNNQNNDSTFSIKVIDYGVLPSKNNKEIAQCSGSSKVYKLENDLIKIDYTIQTVENLNTKDQLSINKTIQIYYYENKPFYVIYSSIHRIRSETISEIRTKFFLNNIEIKNQTDIINYSAIKEEIQKVIYDAEH